MYFPKFIPIFFLKFKHIGNSLLYKILVIFLLSIFFFICEYNNSYTLGTDGIILGLQFFKLFFKHSALKSSKLYTEDDKNRGPKYLCYYSVYMAIR